MTIDRPVLLKVRKDEMEDEIAPYFKREVTPKVLITTTDRPSNVSYVVVYH